MELENKNKSLASNTFFLYLMTFSNYLFGFITIPYQTRVLGPEVFGLIGFSLAFYTYFMLIFDFGFILSGTKRVVLCNNDRNEMGQLLFGITVSKSLFFILLTLLLFILSWISPIMSERFVLLFLYLLLAYLTSLIPDFLYRGLENMKSITLRTVLIRSVFCLLIFVFLKKPSQYFIIPISQIVGTLGALLWVIFDLHKNLKVGFRWLGATKIYHLVKEAFPFFVSRIATTIYSVTNTLILGFVYPTGNVVGLFSSADKFKTIAAQASSPIADSFYPYMVRTKDYGKMYKVIILFECIAVPIAVLVYIYANEICLFAFGSEYAEAGLVLRYVCPICAITLPSYMFGFPALTAIDQEKWANYSVEIAMVSQLVGLFFLFVKDSINLTSICQLTLVSEFLCLIVRLVVFFTKREIS